MGRSAKNVENHWSKGLRNFLLTVFAKNKGRPCLLCKVGLSKRLISPVVEYQNNFFTSTERVSFLEPYKHASLHSWRLSPTEGLVKVKGTLAYALYFQFAEKPVKMKQRNQTNSIIFEIEKRD